MTAKKSDKEKAKAEKTHAERLREGDEHRAAQAEERKAAREQKSDES